jgi:hypothetical protein
MRVAITDLTRMYEGHICVAGVDLETGKRVRPVTFGRLAADLLCTRGGPFDIGRIVDLGVCEPCGTPPEVEDMRFDPARVRVVNAMTKEAFFDLLRLSSGTDLQSFGPALTRHHDSLATAEGTGSSSLHIVRTGQAERIFMSTFEGRGRLRFPWRGGVWLSVTDVRLYEADLQTPDVHKVESLQRALSESTDALLCFGLARAWLRPGDSVARHYLQLNNIHVWQWSDWRLCPDQP